MLSVIEQTPAVITRKKFPSDSPEYSRSYKRSHYLKNRESILKAQKIYHSNNREVRNAASRVRGAKKLPADLESKKLHYERNRKKIIDRAVAWNEKNKFRRREIARNHQARRRESIRGRLDHRMSNGILSSLKIKNTSKAGRRWERIVGYTIDDLKIHLESLFVTGMTWERLMAGDIHIDHKIPKVKFNYNCADDIEFKRCWALENLQPMWAGENLSKGDKITKPSQIPLGV